MILFQHDFHPERRRWTSILPHIPTSTPNPPLGRALASAFTTTKTAQHFSQSRGRSTVINNPLALSGYNNPKEAKGSHNLDSSSAACFYLPAVRAQQHIPSPLLTAWNLRPIDIFSSTNPLSRTNTRIPELARKVDLMIEQQRMRGITSHPATRKIELTFFTSNSQEPLKQAAPPRRSPEP